MDNTIFYLHLQTGCTKSIETSFFLLAHSELFLCTVLDTSIEKGV